METTRRVLVLTDLVDSTRITAELGDERAAALWAAHDDSVRGLIASHRGIEIDKSDGFLVVFDLLPDAIAFQNAYHSALGSFAPPLRARVGVHAGDVTLRRPSADQIARGAKPIEVDGLAKPLAARLMALASGGQTLATSDVAAVSSGARSLGHYRLKGIAEPLEVWALSGERPADGDKAHRVVFAGGRWIGVEGLAHGLGADADPMIGRADELARLDALSRAGARLITLGGPGGVGKTRLAQHWAEEHLADFGGGTFFVDLAATNDEAGLFRAIARALDVQLASDPDVQLGHALHARGKVLLVVDNFEQLVAQAAHLGAWLGAAPELTVLTTSRQRLGLRGEHLLDLDPLPLPPPAEAASVALFVRRAQQLRPDFTLDSDTLPVVVDIVRRLDGLPLALELAAARMRALGIVQLRDRLQKSLGVLKEEARPDRQRTLLAAIAWSWQLLTPEEQVVLREASVFRGAFELDAAESVVSAADDALDLIQGLVDKSLVRAENAGAGRRRYRLLESIRAFGEDKLAASGHEKAVRDRHARWIFTFAASSTTDPHQLSEALPNLRAAILHATTDPVLAREAMPLVHRVRLWTIPEAFELIAIARPFLEGADAGRLLLYESALHHRTGDVTRATELAERAHEIFVGVGEVRESCAALCERVINLWYAGDTRAESAALAAVQAADAWGDERARIQAHSRLAIVWGHQGRVDEAEPFYRERIEFAERADPNDLGLALTNFGALLLINGRWAEAVDVFGRALTAHERLGRKDNMAHALACIGASLTYLDPPRAIEVLASSLTLARSQGFVRIANVVTARSLVRAYLLAGRMEDFVRVPSEMPIERRNHAMADVMGAVREAYLDQAPHARQRLEEAVADLRAMGEAESHWGEERAIASAFIALAEARAGARTFDDALVVARAEAANARSEAVRNAIDREIDRTRPTSVR